MLHIRYTFLCIYGDSGFLCGLWQRNIHTGTSDYRNNIVTPCNYCVGTVGARPQEGRSQHQGRPVGADSSYGAGFCGRYSGPGPDQETTPAPQRWANFPIQQKREQAPAAGPVDQGQRPDSYAPLLIVCLIILPTSRAFYRPRA